MQNMFDTYEKQLENGNNTLRELRDELDEKETNISKLKLLLQQSERTGTDAKRKFEMKCLELTEKIKQVDQLQEKTGLSKQTLILRVQINGSLGVETGECFRI